MMDRLDVVIAGGGVVGATLACALGGAGVRVALIEAQVPAPFLPESPLDARVLAISPGSQHLFQALGIWPQVVRKRSCPYRFMRVWDAGGSGEIHFDSTELGEPHLGIIVENSVLQAALFERLATLETVRVVAPDALATFIVTETGVQITLASSEIFSARLLVGADGAESKVRQQAGIVFAARDYGQWGIVATVSTACPHRYTAWQRFLPSGPLAFLPLSDGSSSIVWSVDQGQAQQLLAMKPEDFEAALGRAFDYCLGPVRLVSARAAFPLRGGQAESYVADRIALIGDAAHVIHPLAGLGANLGITDAAVLAAVLIESRRDVGSLRVLRRYARARRGENLVIQRAMEGFKWLFAQQAWPIRWVRNRGLDATSAVGPVKRQFMHQAMGLGSVQPVLRLFSVNSANQPGPS